MSQRPAPRPDQMPSTRSTPEALSELALHCLQNPILEAVLSSLQGRALILDRNRQTIAANQELLEAMGLRNASPLLGKRPGEVFGCVRVPFGPDGCGTSPACVQCGALLAILASQVREAPAQGECLMRVQQNGKEQAHEFAVRAAPLELESSSLVVFVIQDISPQKRLETLEKVFFHDVANTLQGLRMRSELLCRAEPEHRPALQQITELCEMLDADITHHRLLMEAERGDLKPQMRDLDAQTVLDALVQFFHLHPAARGKRLTLFREGPSAHFQSDHSLLFRVLTNAVLNALEATPPEGEVRAWFHGLESRPSFSIHNAGAIPEDIQRQIFQRSFSTKASRGRGLGTYSMKLLGEDYLGGTWQLHSNPADGTTFTLSLPAPRKTGTA
ncbi:sensor histidine kinase [Holophaga foetida]|uniref:sensor histidine kinase n=1 Tax=Holophaga foetida TaxID=35839 RepID=UPI0002473F5E|nr:HAMP domain-containing sensor histidine kinase [Holophaga foetida]